MKIVLSAYACLPNRGSEGGVGWNWARELSREHQLWVLTSEWNRDEIEKSGGLANVNFIYISDRWVKLAWLIPWGVGGWLYNYWWQYKSFLTARELHKVIGFELAHHLTYASWRIPSFLKKLGIPFIWGPVGGGEEVPPGFFKALGWQGWIKEQVRFLANRLSRFDPFVRATMKNANLILCSNKDTHKILPREFLHKSHVMLQVGIDMDERRQLPTGKNQGPFQILWVGRILPLKALPVLLWALKPLRYQFDFRLRVIGDGPDRKRCAGIARNCGIADRVDFIGWLPHEKVKIEYQNADLFVFTSLRDSVGTVVFEAMASGLPLVVMDCGGPKEVIGEAGICIPVNEGMEKAITELSNAIATIAADPALRENLSQKALTHVEAEHTWWQKPKLLFDLAQSFIQNHHIGRHA